MIAFLGLVWRRLTVGPCEDVGTLLEAWSDERARQAAATAAKLDQGLTLSSYGPAVVLDAETAATFRRERMIAALLAEHCEAQFRRLFYGEPAAASEPGRGCSCAGVHTCGRLS